MVTCEILDRSQHVLGFDRSSCFGASVQLSLQPPELPGLKSIHDEPSKPNKASFQ
jgi:hypothetical protein